MGEGVRGLMGTGRSRVEFEDCGVGRVNLECAWHVFGVWATQGLMGEAWKRVVWSLEKWSELKAQPNLVALRLYRLQLWLSPRAGFVI